MLSDPDVTHASGAIKILEVEVGVLQLNQVWASGALAPARGSESTEGRRK